MAIISKGILGGFHGKVGEIVGSSWRGINVIRSLPKRVKRASTEKQIIQRAKFSLVIAFIKPLREFLLKSYNDRSLKQLTSTNLISSEILREAVKGEYPNLILDYSKITISKGSLTQLPDLNYVKTEKTLDLTWKSNEGLLGETKALNVFGIIFSEKNRNFSLIKIGTYNLLKGSINLDTYKKGEKFVVWLFNSDEPNVKFSDSIFLGEFVL